MAEELDLLRKLALQVRNATDYGENTAERVGRLFVGILDNLGSIDIPTYENFWEKRTIDGQEYLFTKLPVVTERDITAYAGDPIPVPSIYSGLPLDNDTIAWQEGKLTVIGGTGTAFDESAMWAALSASSTYQIDKSHLSTALSGYWQKDAEAISHWNTAYKYVHEHANISVLDDITEDSVKSWNAKLDKSVWDKAFYFDANNNLRVKLNLIGEKEVSAWGEGESGGQGVVTIVDNLTSTAADCALSANQGRVLKSLIDSKVSSVSWTDITGKPTSFTPSSHTHAIANITGLQTALDDKLAASVFNLHADSALHITSDERTAWNAKLDKSVWDKAFYFVGDKLHVKLNLVGDGEVSAYGDGESSGGGIITIVDNLLSTAADCALSANQGRVLKSLIDGKISSVAWDDVTGKPATFTPSAHSHSDYVLKSGDTLDGNLTAPQFNGYLNGTAAFANALPGWIYQGTVMGWGNQTGAVLSCWADAGGGGIGFRRDNPIGGQMSMVIDGTVYVNEGLYPVYHSGNANRTDADWTANISHANKFRMLNTGSYMYGDGTVFSFVTSVDSAAGIQVGNVLVSDTYSDWTKVPTNGIYSKGTVRSNGNNGSPGFLHKVDSGVWSYLRLESGSVSWDLALVDSTGAFEIRRAGSDTQRYLFYSDRFLPASMYAAHLGDYAKRWHGVWANYGDFDGIVTAAQYNTHGWYYNTVLNAGLYNSAGDARWYYNGMAWYADKHIMLPYDGGMWINMANSGRQLIPAQRNSTGSAHSLIRLINSNGSAICYGGLGVSVGFYGFTASRIANGTNGTDWQTYWNVDTGGLSHSGDCIRIYPNPPVGNFDEGIRIYPTSHGWSTIILCAANDVGTSATTWGIHANKNDNVFIIDRNAATGANGLRINSAGNMQVGYGYDIGYKFAVAGNVWASSGFYTDYWFRSIGATGWYNETYGGGIFMEDSTWVRVYNGKSFYCSSNILAGGEVTAYSDRRLKSNIRPLVHRGFLSPVTYTKNGKQSIGFIAQDVQTMYPELVTVDKSTPDEYLSLNYAQITAVLALQIYMLYKEIELLKQKIK